MTLGPPEGWDWSIGKTRKQPVRSSPEEGDVNDYRQLLAYSDSEMARLDPLVMNLLVATSVPELAGLDIAHYERLADQWAEDVRRRLPGAEKIFWRTPEHWKSDVNFFRLVPRPD
jgi:hypothetical protein